MEESHGEQEREPARGHRRAFRRRVAQRLSAQIAELDASGRTPAHAEDIDRALRAARGQGVGWADLFAVVKARGYAPTRATLRDRMRRYDSAFLPHEREERPPPPSPFDALIEAWGGPPPAYVALRLAAHRA